MTLLTNFPLWAALSAIVFAQVIKIPIKLLFTKEFQPGLAFSTGGMPSSHSAAVASLATAIGIAEGVSSSVFALACIFSVITMFDASGVRRQAGEQAIVINQLVRDFQLITSSAKGWSKKKENEKIQELKELLGHQPIEVFFGAITGIIIAFSLAPLFSY
ncbi:divergent PAP2 family protein [Oceanobacillus jeddahense]|uniref:Divergent PAP2 family protein n=1 Tax=Oceanobacillus jeddahense TaxID=1462527 RepID=A0ABY5JNQ1_9BACI|nr:divergent PAP2 family protein [Oceanobacillus jeddahense]UUI01923.1 divergent PAP2 family protein [Oceanobacillus jeddahense]